MNYPKLLKWIYHIGTNIPGTIFILQTLGGLTNNVNVGNGDAAINARYCYSVWMRHLLKAHELGMVEYPKNICEFGPGASLGVGIAALLGGGKVYIAMDIVNQSSYSNNLAVVDELLKLYDNNSDIPDDDEFPEVLPKLSSYKFPSELIKGDSNQRHALAKKIKSDLLTQNSNEEKRLINFYVPWTSGYDNKINVDFLLSQAVMEHVDEIDNAYNSMSKLVKDGGYMAHVIDFRSHGTHRYYNGQYSYSLKKWTIMRGTKRPYFINRKLLSEHINSILNNNFKIVCSIPNYPAKNVKKLIKDKASSDFKSASDDDFYCRSEYLLAKKNIILL